MPTLFSPLKLAQNPIVVNVDAADPITIVTRSGLRYFLELMVPDYYGANTFSRLVEFEGSERPPEAVAGGYIYRGAFFELQDQLDSLLERTAPTFGQVGISVCDGLITPYYVKYRIENNDVTIVQQSLPVQYAIKAGISERDFSVYKHNFFTDYIGKSGRFLTWGEDGKRVQPNQPEFLYWLCNCSPLPAGLKLQVEVLGTASVYPPDIFTAATLASITPMTVYCLAVGPEALGLTTRPGVVAGYKVWLEDSAGNILTEVRSYRMDPEFRRNVRFVLFANSLGGYDTLCLTGQGEETLTLARNISDRYPDYAYNPQYAEKVINSATGERQLTINTGWLKESGRNYLQELALTKDAYIATDRAFLPLIPSMDSIRHWVDDEGPIGRQLTFKYANPERNFSNLPALTIAQARETGWRPKATACLLDDNGRRTGKKGVMLIEKYYLDDNTRVVETPIKANTPGTAGYISPADSADCATTPYLSVAVSGAGSFVRTTCPAGQFGGYATITIPAGTYGSEISQADADAKASAAWAALNTQDYANTNGSCVLGAQYYAWTVPGGKFHYRTNSPVNFYIYSTGSYPAGNIWTLPSGPDVYAINTNDLDLPIGVSATSAQWVYEMKSPIGAGTGQVKIYVNGVLKETRTLDYNSGVGRPLFNGFTGVAGDKVYMEFTHIQFGS
ncbi:hypothetical protein GO730_20985 [Spirosoma sp. HMF3257]|uniref:DUF5977 domain-containing protein n=1 Tax=Spirosoma telluris TaxID=2183553 RepID=A0A327NQH3_9BACT|nr:hypothetical protein [Spirosoma telluris]RAI76024.1 hypothetical protein HMF3257_20910 [Spirosoma telluris]